MFHHNFLASHGGGERSRETGIFNQWLGKASRRIGWRLFCRAVSSTPGQTREAVLTNLRRFRARAGGLDKPVMSQSYFDRTGQIPRPSYRQPSRELGALLLDHPALPDAHHLSHGGDHVVLVLPAFLTGDWQGGPISLVGIGLGGVLARDLACSRPRDDGIVAWQTCYPGDSAGDSETAIEVRGAHVSIGCNPQALTIVAERLAGGTRGLAGTAACT